MLVEQFLQHLQIIVPPGVVCFINVFFFSFQVVCTSVLSDIHSLAVLCTLAFTKTGTLQVWPVVVHKAACPPNVVFNIALKQFLHARRLLTEQEISLCTLYACVSVSVPGCNRTGKL